MTGIIFVKGEIGVDYTISNALIDLEKNKTAEVFKIYIDSPGGDYTEGRKIYDLFSNSGKIIITENSGMVASMAVNLFLLGSQRYFDPAKGEFLIHNPWADAQGDADTLSEYSKELKKAEKVLIDLYVQKTGVLQEVITGLMKEDKPLTPEQIEALGFAKIIHNEFKAVAKFNINEMTEKELNDKIEEKSKGIFSKITAFLKKSGMIKALVLKTADNKDLDFGEAINDPAEIAVGAEAKVAGAPAEGDFLLPDGSTLVFAGGKLTEIKPKPEENDEMEALKTENATLKEQNTALSGQVTSAQALLKDVQKDLATFKASITSDIKGFRPEKQDDEKELVRKPFKN